MLKEEERYVIEIYPYCTDYKNAKDVYDILKSLPEKIRHDLQIIIEEHPLIDSRKPIKRNIREYDNNFEMIPEYNGGYTRPDFCSEDDSD